MQMNPATIPVRVIDYNEFNAISLVTKNKDFNEFRRLVAQYLSDEYLEKYIKEKNITYSVTELRVLARNEIINLIAYLFEPNMIDTASYEFLNIMINEFEYEIDDSLLGSLDHMSIDAVIYFSKFGDIGKYTWLIKKLFRRLCQDSNTITDLEKLKELGFTIEELCEEYDNTPYYLTVICSSISNNDVVILKYLLDHGMQFKKYETQAFLHCIKHMKLAHIKILVEYGGDINILNKISSARLEDKIFEMYNYLKENDVKPDIIAAIFYKQL